MRALTLIHFEDFNANLHVYTYSYENIYFENNRQEDHFHSSMLNEICFIDDILHQK